LKTLNAIVEKTIGKPCVFTKVQSINGGCINDALRVDTEEERLFVKRNNRSFLDAFQNEAAALEEIAATNTIRVPRVLTSDTMEEDAYLILEFIDEGPPIPANWETMGRQLAALHSIEQPYFGWKQDNVIGSTHQPNPQSQDWVSFFRDYRLRHQFALCAQRGYSFEKSEALITRVSDFFDTSPKPSLLHGDLWSGNASFDSSGSPFLFDPGSYYGDREADIAFTEFFGGFDQRFYEAYEEAAPLDSGYIVRKNLYNLYHCLNHAYIFGGSYAHQARGMIDHLLAVAQ